MRLRFQRMRTASVCRETAQYLDDGEYVCRAWLVLVHALARAGCKADEDRTTLWIIGRSGAGHESGGNGTFGVTPVASMPLQYKKADAYRRTGCERVRSGRIRRNRWPQPRTARRIQAPRCSDGGTDSGQRFLAIGPYFIAAAGRRIDTARSGVRPAPARGPATGYVPSCPRRGIRHCLDPSVNAHWALPHDRHTELRIRCSTSRSNP